jgi:hypothetical protein
MQWAIYTHGNLYGANPPAIYLLGESTKPREGERIRRSILEEEAMAESGRPKLCRPEVKGKGSGQWRLDWGGIGGG